MKTAMSILLGFALTPAFMLLLGVFAFCGVRFDLDKGYTLIGAVGGVAVFVMGTAIAFKVWGP